MVQLQYKNLNFERKEDDTEYVARQGDLTCLKTLNKITKQLSSNMQSKQSIPEKRLQMNITIAEKRENTWTERKAQDKRQTANSSGSLIN